MSCRRWKSVGSLFGDACAHRERRVRCLLPGVQPAALSLAHVLPCMGTSSPYIRSFRSQYTTTPVAKAIAATNIATKQTLRHTNPRDSPRCVGCRTTLVLRGLGGGPGASLSLRRDAWSKVYGSGVGVEPRSGGVMMGENTGRLEEVVTIALSRS